MRINMEKIKELPIESLLRQYKKLLRDAPNTIFSSDEAMDIYYEAIYEVEKEIIMRVKEEPCHTTG